MTKLIYLETCLPDYHQGFSGPHVYAVPVSNDDTYETVLNTLSELIAHEEIYGFSDEQYTELEKSFRKLKEAWQSCANDIFDKNAPSYDEDSQDTVYAYFGVKP